MVEINEKIASHEKLIKIWKPRAKELNDNKSKRQFRFMIKLLKSNIKYFEEESNKL